MKRVLLAVSAALALSACADYYGYDDYNGGRGYYGDSYYGSTYYGSPYYGGAQYGRRYYDHHRGGYYPYGGYRGWYDGRPY